MGKKIAACLMAVLLLCSSMSALAAAPQTTSQSVCVMDADTGEILYEKDAYTQLPMASITKTMTALVAMENSDLQGTTTATNEALATVDLASTRIGFEAGENLTLDELMYCMLVYSANDAANILAAAVGGTVDNFVAMMNAKAEELGCTHTHFMNPNGLDADGHYTCAHDMAIITQAANKYPAFAKYAGAVTYTLPADNVIGDGWQIKTKVNALEQGSPVYDARIYAAKTGWTTKAHNTFIACAKTSDGSNMIVTLLNCPVKNGIFTETTALLNYAESAYPKLTVPTDAFEKQAKKAVKKAGGKLDEAELQAVTLRLPSSMTEKDLSYACAQTPSGVQLQISVAEGSRKAYQEETGLDGSTPLATVMLPVMDDKTEKQKQTVQTQSQPEKQGLVASVQQKLSNLPKLAQDAILGASIVVCAIVLMFVILFSIRLYNQRKRRKKKQSRP